MNTIGTPTSKLILFFFFFSFDSQLQFSRDDYFNNVQTLRKWSTDYAFGLLRKANKKGE